MTGLAAAAWSVCRFLSELVLPPVCPRCRARARKGGVLCGDCLGEALEAKSDPVAPPGISRLFAGPELVPPLKSLVHGLKYEGHREAAAELVEIAATASGPDEDAFRGAVLVPVPLHGPRRRERGYNQSELLARAWSGRLGIPVARDWMARTRDTGTQTRLGSAERRRNLEGAFQVGRTFRAGVPVVLVDDVLTTGSTLSSCAAVLLAAGAPSVHALCVAWAGEA